MQDQLDVQYAVERTHFNAVDDYSRYVRIVVTAERGGLCSPAQWRSWVWPIPTIYDAAQRKFWSGHSRT